MKKFLIAGLVSFLFLFLILIASSSAQMDLPQNETVSGEEESAVIQSEDASSAMPEDEEKLDIKAEEEKQCEETKDESLVCSQPQEQKRDVYEEMTQTVLQVENISRAADELLKLGKAKTIEEQQLKDKFREFEQEIENTLSQIETLCKTTRHVSTQGEIFFNDWLRELESIKNSTMRRRGMTSRDKELKTLSGFNDEAQKTEENLNKLIEAIQDIDRYLKFNLTAKNVSSAASEFRKINTDAGKIKKGIGSMEKKLKKLSAFSEIMNYNKY
ncbi:MAG: DUF2959 family protein [Candidatus Omnitrophica bacterium]|nr:DUF2959 family protein [Candidatus Omnitrophota bacterium]